MSLSIRSRLTVWYSAVLAILLCIFAVVSLVLLRRAISRTLDRSLRESTAQAGALLQEEVREMSSTFDTEAVTSAISGFRGSGTTVLLFDAKGELVASSEEKPPNLTPRPGPGFHELGGSRFLVSPVNLRQSRFFIITAHSTRPAEETVRLVAQTFALAIPIAIAISAVAGYLLARKALDPVVTITRTAREITAARLGDRIAVRNAADELGQLATTLNALLERLQSAFASQLRFMADASHELRTPVAVVQGEADVALQRERTADEYRESLGVVQKAAGRMGRIVRDLLFLARADVAPPRLKEERLYVDDVIADAARDARALAAGTGVTVDHVTAAPMPARGDADLLKEMILTVVENAMRHSPHDGVVTISAAANNGSYQIEIRDTGEGVPDHARELIFERFYRADSSRGRTGAEKSFGSGTGLGLPIARAIARAHGGDVVLHSTGASGSTFVISLPV